MTLQGFTRDYLAALFHYDADTGIVRRLVSRGRWLAGQVVGTVDGKGYLHVNVAGKFVLLHRLAYFLASGTVPERIDHENGVKTDNRLVNLRPCNQAQNMGNVAMYAHNTSGYKGVSRNSRSGMWHAQIKLHGKQTCLGRDDNPHIAALLYNAAAADHFGAFAHFNLLSS